MQIGEKMRQNRTKDNFYAKKKKTKKKLEERMDNQNCQWFCQDILFYGLYTEDIGDFEHDKDTQQQQ